MLQIVNRLKMARALGRLIENPAQTEEIFKLSRLGRASKDQRPVQALIAFASQNREFVELFQSGYLPAMPTMAELRTYAPGTLGAAYFQHLSSNGLQPDFFPEEDATGMLGYIIQRVRQTHDLWHVLAGYDTSVAGEMGLQAFTIAQVRNSLSVTLLFGGMLHLSLQHPAELSRAMDLVMEGYARGKQARFLLAIRWEEMFGETLESARALAGLKTLHS